MNKPLINYYARIIVRGDYKLDDVPEKFRELVREKIEEIKEATQKEDQ